jgi:hypothetical protein
VINSTNLFVEGKMGMVKYRTQILVFGCATACLKEFNYYHLNSSVRPQSQDKTR